jgi:hypothetical protein
VLQDRKAAPWPLPQKRAARSIGRKQPIKYSYFSSHISIDFLGKPPTFWAEYFLVGFLGKAQQEGFARKVQVSRPSETALRNLLGRLPFCPRSLGQDPTYHLLPVISYWACSRQNQVALTVCLQFVHWRTRGGLYQLDTVQAVFFVVIAFT